jgi:hypothetical protein
MTKLTGNFRVLREHAWKSWYQTDKFVALLYKKPQTYLGLPVKWLDIVRV